MYAKLINGKLQIAPNPLITNNKVIANPTNEMLMQEGYLPVVEITKPSDTTDYYYKDEYEIKDNQILQSWKQVYFITNLDEIKTLKIKELSTECNKTIIDGFDIVLSDNNKYHFSLTYEDQINLITLSGMVQAGEEYIPYHADDGECKYYSTEDMNRIITVGTTFKTYHTTYFNSLKTFVNSLTDNEIVRSIEYGINIPDEYKSDVLRQLEQAVNGANG